MIIDSHAYCFEAADSLMGYDSAAEHLQWVQAGQAGHYQQAFSVRDRAIGSSEALAPLGTDVLSGLPDVNFRIDHAAGRVAWTIDGEDYTKHYYPPNLRNCEFTPDSLISEMDYAGVDMALLHTNPMLGRSSAYQAECVRRFPDRFRSMAPVDEWRIRDDADSVIRELEESITKHELHAVKFNANGYKVSAEPWDDGSYRAFWESAVALNVPIFFSLSTGPRDKSWVASKNAQDGYLNELKILMRWMERYPDTTCSITHGFPYRAFIDGDAIKLPDAVWEPFQNPKLSIEVSFPVRIGDMFDFPYREVLPTIQSMVEKIGANRLLWGTDMPFQNRHCTYRQSARPHRKIRRFPEPGRIGFDNGRNRITHLRALARLRTVIGYSGYRAEAVQGNWTEIGCGKPIGSFGPGDIINPKTQKILPLAIGITVR